MLDALAFHKCSKTLFDGRKLIGKPETIERFFYGEFAAQTVERFVVEQGAFPAPRFAYVLREPMLDPERFGETVAVNRGMDVKAFDNPDEALRWLRSDNSPRPITFQNEADELRPSRSFER